MNRRQVSGRGFACQGRRRDRGRGGWVIPGGARSRSCGSDLVGRGAPRRRRVGRARCCLGGGHVGGAGGSPSGYVGRRRRGPGQCFARSPEGAMRSARWCPGRARVSRVPPNRLSAPVRRRVMGKPLPPREVDERLVPSAWRKAVYANAELSRVGGPGRVRGVRAGTEPHPTLNNRSVFASPSYRWSDPRPAPGRCGVGRGVRGRAEPGHAPSPSTWRGWCGPLDANGSGRPSAWGRRART